MNGIELRHLTALLALADDPNFGRAALRLNVAQSTLSRTLADLETLVGVILVERAQRTVGLTSAGRALLPRAIEAIRAVESGVADARAADADAIVLGVQGSSGHSWLADVRRRLAGAVDFELRVLDRAAGFGPLGTTVDAMICPLPIVVPSELRTLTLGRSQPYVALPAAHPAATADAVAIGAMCADPVILPPLADVWWRDLDLILRSQGCDLRPGPEAGSMFEVLTLVAAGEGWSYAPARADFHPWEGVALRPAAGAPRVEVALAWSEASAVRAAPLVAALETTRFAALASAA